MSEDPNNYIGKTFVWAKSGSMDLSINMNDYYGVLAAKLGDYLEIVSNIQSHLLQCKHIDGITGKNTLIVFNCSLLRDTISSGELVLVEEKPKLSKEWRVLTW